LGLDQHPKKVKRMADRADVAVFPPALFGGSLLLGFVLQRLAPRPVLPKGIARVVGVALTASAIGVMGAALRELRKARTTIDVREPTTAVVKTGIYAHTRNPIYLGMILIHFGIGSLRNSGWHLLLAIPAAAALQAGVIAREEAYLERKFGGEYVDYKARVRRWI
jgi:protein-S-isoprenylcysteine O-methyltransferase Ste14